MRLSITLCSGVLMAVSLLGASPILSAQKKSKSKAQSTTNVKVDYTTFNTLLPVYLNASTSGLDYTSPLTGLLMNYTALTDNQKKAWCENLLKVAEGYYDADKLREVLALERLYTSVPYSRTPQSHEAFSFYRGVYAAFNDGDTVVIKNVIDSIAQIPVSMATPNRDRRVAVLNNYLQQIRDYVPTHNLIGGTWICHNVMVNTGYPNLTFRCTPSIQKTGDATIWLNPALSGMLHGGGFAEVLSLDQLNSHEVFSFGTDSVYCMWTSEDMKNPSPELNYLVRGVGGSFASALGQKVMIEGGGSFAGNALGGAIGSIAAAGISAIADELFTPTKKAMLLQLKLKRINSRQLEGDILYSTMKVKGDKEPELHNITCQSVLFTRVEPEDSVYFLEQSGISIPIFEVPIKGTKRLGGLVGKMCKDVRQGMVSGQTEAFNFNVSQMDKQNYNTMMRLKADDEKTWSERGINPTTQLYHVIGVIAHQSKSSPEGGLMIDKPMKGLPAHIAKLKKGDVIMSVDGFEVSTIEQLNTIINRKEPYKDITVKVRRGKKEFEVVMQPVINSSLLKIK